MDKSSSEKREYKRHQLEKEIPLNFEYTIDAELDFIPQVGQENSAIKYHAVAKNLSVEGVCIQADRELTLGEHLKLEFYVRGSDIPVHMQGQVCWSKEACDERGFDSGLILKTIEGRTVHETVHYDEVYKVYWSDVLEIITEIQKKIRLKNNKG
jgi:hypothetical protein